MRVDADSRRQNLKNIRGLSAPALAALSRRAPIDRSGPRIAGDECRSLCRRSPSPDAPAQTLRPSRTFGATLPFLSRSGGTVHVIEQETSATSTGRAGTRVGRRPSRTDLPGRSPWFGQGHTGRHPGRRSDARQRRHQRRALRRDQRGRGVLLHQRPAGRLHGASVAGRLSDRRAEGPPHRHAAGRGSGLHARSRRADRATHGHRAGAGRRACHRVGGDDDDGGADHGDPALRPQYVLRGDCHAQRHPVRRSAVRALSGSVRLLAAVARRRPASRQRLPDRGRLDHRLRQPRVVGAFDRGGRGHEGAAQDLRRGNGPRRRRRLQRHRQVGLQRVARQRAVHQQAGLGHGPAVLRQARRHSQSAAALLLVGRLDRRPDQDGPHVLLVQQGRLHAAQHAQQRPDVPDCARAHGRLLAVASTLPAR